MKTVLIIEPDRIFNENLVELLELEGFNAIGFINTDEAIIAVNLITPSVILCDESALTEEFRKLNENLIRVHNTTDTFIIIIDGTEDIFKEADAYLTMPFHDEELLSILLSHSGKIVA